MQYQRRQAKVVAMTAQAAVSTSHEPASAPVAEYQAWSIRGANALVGGAVAVAGGVALLWYSHKQTADAIQTETAVRHVASSYPYTRHGEGELSLRDNADEITGRLSAEIADRVASAGVTIIESRLTRLSYAAEIAQAMLRQQQASAVVGARMRIVEGAVGMVQLALQRLKEEDVVDLDEERKAAMVSNLLVVLCSEQATQQVVNTGSLYQ
jgi:hypothetical protein